MKYRECKIPEGLEIDFDNVPERNADKWNTAEYKIKVITPIYGGGVEAGKPDEEMPIRASAIRGQLRYWWRFLAMNHPKKSLSGEELFKEERRIWGGIGDEKELKDSGKRDFSSKVFIKVNITKPPKNKKIDPDKFFPNKKNGIKYALFSAIQNNHEVTEEGCEFALSISNSGLSNGDNIAVQEAIRWWICFGGIGARTRRGLGSIECLSSTVNFKPLKEEDVSQYPNCQLIMLDADDASDAWDKAVGFLQKFRQGADIGRKHKEDTHGNKLFYDKGRVNPELGQSFWPEADSIRDITGKKGHPILHKDCITSFPRAAFGLPIIFDFNTHPSKGEPPKTELTGCEEEGRMASPLILKAMKSVEGIKAIALLMPHSHLDTLSVFLTYSGFSDYKEQVIINENKKNKNLSWNEKKNKKRKVKEMLAELEEKLPKNFSPNEWNDPNKARHIAPITGWGTDALTAFMNFFAKGGKK